jgi:tetratricopeptide (TPR) repeat protein
LGNIKAASGDYSKAERHYTRAILLDPSMFQAYFSRGLLRMKAGYIEDALKDFEETVRISPSMRGAYIQKGLANQKLGKVEQSHRDFENAATMDPRDPYALFYYAGALEARKEPLDALNYYNQALTRNPKPELRKLIQERISALGSVHGPESSKNPQKRTKDLW